MSTILTTESARWIHFDIYLPINLYLHEEFTSSPVKVTVNFFEYRRPRIAGDLKRISYVSCK